MIVVGRVEQSMDITSDNAQEVWDAASDAHHNAHRVLLREAIELKRTANLRKGQGFHDHAERLTRSSDTIFAAMIVLGMENIDEIRQAIDEQSTYPGQMIDEAGAELEAGSGSVGIARPKQKPCPNPECDAPASEQEVRNHSVRWGDGEVHCTRCGTFVRHWESG